MEMVRRINLSKKLVLAFSVLGTVAAIIAVIGMININNGIQSAQRTYEYDVVPIDIMGTAGVNYQSIRISLRDALLSPDQNEVAKYVVAVRETHKKLENNLGALDKTIKTDEQRSAYSKVLEEVKQYTDWENKVIAAAEASKRDEGFALLHNEQYSALTKSISGGLENLKTIKASLAEKRLTEDLDSGRHANYVMIVFACFGLVGGVLLGLFISAGVKRQLGGDPVDVVKITHLVAAGNLAVNIDLADKPEDSVMAAMKHMVGSLRTIVSQTVGISNGITSAAQQLRSTAEEIATSAEQVASQAGTVATASEEMAATSADIARNCTMAADASQHSTEAANIGIKVVRETISGMGIIADRVRRTAGTIEALGARSEQIGDIIGTIEDIADQTNLLALNAAIEAARAGEQGRGFAVVADEVRALAERTTKATKEIGTMIKAIQSETKEAVMTMEEGVHEVEKGAVSSKKSGDALAEILQRINQVSRQINQVATAAEEQTATTSEVTTNVQQITEVVYQTAKGAEETSSAAAKLAGQAQELQTLVGNFKL